VDARDKPGHDELKAVFHLQSGRRMLQCAFRTKSDIA
jgi:hypothetical protein